MKRYLSAGAIFKNEGHALREWVEHNLHHGVEHIYLIDDGSSDGGSDAIRDYVERGDVTLFREEDHPVYFRRQPALYDRYILPHAHQTRWLMIVDLDEFMWSPRSVDLRPVLEQLEDAGQVQAWPLLFGSNGHVQTPPGLVASYTRRAREFKPDPIGVVKYFIHAERVAISSLRVHTARFQPKAGLTAPYPLLGEDWLVFNHYCCQSLEFWRDVKCTRGDADHFRTRTLEEFATFDINEVEDTRLLDQNRPILVAG